MAKKQSDGVYRIIDVVGVSETSWEDAGRIAVETAAGSLRDLRVAEVTKMDMRWITERSRRFAPASHFRSSTRLDPIFNLRVVFITRAARAVDRSCATF